MRHRGSAAPRGLPTLFVNENHSSRKAGDYLAAPTTGRRHFCGRVPFPAAPVSLKPLPPPQKALKRWGRGVDNPLRRPVELIAFTGKSHAV